MRIAYLAPEFVPPWGGVGVYSTHLIKELSKYRDMEIHVFTPVRGEGYDKKKVEAMFGGRVKIFNISVARDEFVYNLIFQYNVAKQLPEFHRKYHYDIIHAANLVHMPDIFLKFRELDARFVVTAHTTIEGQLRGLVSKNKGLFHLAPSEKGSVIAFPYIWLMEQLYLRKTGYMISVSHRSRQEFIASGFKGRITTIHNGTDTSLFNSRLSKENAHKLFPQLKGKKNLVLYAGRLISQKGIRIFIEMASRLSGRGIHFVIAGNGDVNGLKRLIKKYSLKESEYSFLGFVKNTDMGSLYRLCSVFVLPSYSENLPISIIEAMSCGCVPIASDVGAVREIIRDGIDGFTVMPGDVEGLLHLTSYIVENRQLRRAMADEGSRRARERFSVRMMARKTREFYEMMINENPAS
ncbi:hypothetical protein COT48_03945 [Candidatus Woesearchaeota archaeon CG08_land_8_20_14_0_20_47_9]|nr:MAG: hypothetical protein AUJ69_00515 [Candidatus Woesearchaeota archaeon CG1_02_47_18]PIO03681.1 MAG: hypothetical protein COT48_03945 [Candidatus Woesearchaeota archaeon CG08_land_8_20_14_0_20_47_9]HII30060.1 glycosyltransferase family 4 protein [Candidatus Woesearchaeota archaeon]